MEAIKIVIVLQIMLVTAIGCSQHTKMNKKSNPMNQKGKIKGKIINLPDREILEIVQISLNQELYFSQTIDSLGNFTTKEIAYGTYALKIFHDESHYPILIKNFRLNDEIVDLGELPLFKDPFGYQAQWGELADENESSFYYRHPIHDKTRDSLEMTYQEMFLRQSRDKELKFETINISIDSTNNTIESWRFAVVKNRKLCQEKNRTSSEKRK